MRRNDSLLRQTSVLSGGGVGNRPKAFAVAEVALAADGHFTLECDCFSSQRNAAGFPG